jgi:hypothetical protein
MGRIDQLSSTAYHEAGHAVAALRLGVGIGRRGVSIVPGEGFLGKVHVLMALGGRPDVEITGAMRLKAESQVIVSLAGTAAQRRFRASSVRSYHGRSDIQGAFKLLSFFTFSRDDQELKAYFRLLQIRAEVMVATPLWWTQIDAVAGELLTRKHLSVSEVKTIARGALGYPIPKPLKCAPELQRQRRKSASIK